MPQPQTRCSVPYPLSPIPRFSLPPYPLPFSTPATQANYGYKGLPGCDPAHKAEKPWKEFKAGQRPPLPVEKPIKAKDWLHLVCRCAP